MSGPEAWRTGGSQGEGSGWESPTDGSLFWNALPDHIHTPPMFVHPSAQGLLARGAALPASWVTSSTTGQRSLSSCVAGELFLVTATPLRGWASGIQPGAGYHIFYKLKVCPEKQTVMYRKPHGREALKEGPQVL